MTTATLAKRDNGYFEIWALPCGHEVRVMTEDQQWGLRRPGARAAMHAATRTRLARPGVCPDCPKA